MKILASVVVLAASVAVCQAAGPRQLRFKPSAGLTYSQKRTEKVNRTGWNGANEDFTFTVQKKLAETVQRLEDGTLRRHIKQLEGSLTYLGKPSATSDKQAEYEERVDVRGNELANVPGAEGAEPGRMRLVLPEDAVGEGSMWQYVAPASHQFPAPLTTHFKLESFKEFRGRRCACIRVRTKYEGRHGDRNVAVDLRSRGRVYFDVDAGVVVNAISTTQFTLDFLRDKQDGRPKHEAKTIDILYSISE